MAYITSFALLLLQIICFSFMYNKKSEFLSLILILVLHVLFLLQFVSLNRNGIYFTIFPYIFFGWDGKVPLSIIFILSWILLLTAIAIFVDTYRRLHGAYRSIDKEVDLGDRMNYQWKENVKISILCSTAIMWIIFGYEIITTSVLLQNNFFYSIYRAMQKSSTNLIIMTSFLSLFTTSGSVYLANQFNNKMNIITLAK